MTLNIKYATIVQLNKRKYANSMNPALTWAVATITSLAQVGYTGKIEINFFQGGVSGVNFSQSIKPLTEVRIVPVGREVAVMN